MIKPSSMAMQSTQKTPWAHQPQGLQCSKLLVSCSQPTIPLMSKWQAAKQFTLHAELLYPKGAASTVKVEETRLKGNKIEVIREIKSGEGIIPMGDDVKQGALLLKSGQVLRPQDIGLLASIGMAEAEVFKKPLVAIISGGDELIKQCKKDPAKIANNYALVIAGLASELGATITVQGNNA